MASKIRETEGRGLGVLRTLCERDSLLSGALKYLIRFPFGPVTARAVAFDMVADEDDIIEEVDEIKPVMRDEECSGPNGVGC